MLYHYTLGFPATLQMPCGHLRLTYSRHALSKYYQSKALQLRSLLTVLNTALATIIEIEVEQGKIVKVLFRLPYTTCDDLIIAVNYGGDKHGLVRTMWLNGRYDNHKTLDVSRYNRP